MAKKYERCQNENCLIVFPFLPCLPVEDRGSNKEHWLYMEQEFLALFHVFVLKKGIALNTNTGETQVQRSSMLGSYRGLGEQRLTITNTFFPIRLAGAVAMVTQMFAVTHRKTYASDSTIPSFLFFVWVVGRRLHPVPSKRRKTIVECAMEVDGQVFDVVVADFMVALISSHPGCRSDVILDH